MTNDDEAKVVQKLGHVLAAIARRRRDARIKQAKEDAARSEPPRHYSLGKRNE